MTELIIERTFDAPIRTVWQAWTDPALLPRWQGPAHSTSRMHRFELRPGGISHYEMIFEGAGSTFGKCIYQRIEPFARLEWINGFADDGAAFIRHPAAPAWPLSWRNVLELTDLGSRTRMCLILRPHEATRTEAAAFVAGFEAMRDGWSGTLTQLADLLASIVTRRAHAALSLATEGADRVVIDRAFAAPPAAVFEAFTTPERLRQWMLGPGDGWRMPICEVDLVIGGRCHYGWASESGDQMSVTGTFEVIDAPTLLVHREAFEPDWTGGSSRITTRFVAEGAGTRVILAIDYPSPEVRDMVIESPMLAGMEASYARLDRLLPPA